MEKSHVTIKTVKNLKKKGHVTLKIVINRRKVSRDLKKPLKS